MAYVAISTELQHAVRDGIKAMARKELETIGEVPKLKGTEPFIEEAHWGSYAHLRGQIPKEWKREASTIFLRVEFPDGTWQEPIGFVAAQDTPPTYSPYSYAKATVHADHPDIAHIAAVISNRRDAQKRWKEVEEQVMAFLLKCKSLNEGLKLWPDLRMYIPKHYLDRVERKVDRPKEASGAADVLKSIDTNQIVAAAVIARMSTGSTDS